MFGTPITSEEQPQRPAIAQRYIGDRLVEGVPVPNTARTMTAAGGAAADRGNTIDRDGALGVGDDFNQPGRTQPTGRK